MGSGNIFASCSSRGTFFACNILVFKLFMRVLRVYLLVYTCIYLYILLFTFEGLFTVFTNYPKNYSAKNIPRRMFRRRT